VVVAPLPVVAIAPGVLVKVHDPVAGKPFRTTLPVAKSQVGWVIVPTVGAVGVAGCALITTLADAKEVHPAAFVTVKVYVPSARSGNVKVVPVPVLTIAPGDAVKVQSPVAGSPLRATLPVASAQVGWVIVPTVGAVGVPGFVLTVTLADAKEVHPAAFFTVKVYVPAARSVKV